MEAAKKGSVRVPGEVSSPRSGVCKRNNKSRNEVLIDEVEEGGETKASSLGSDSKKFHPPGVQGIQVRTQLPLV